MAGNGANEVVAAGGLEGDGGGATAVGAEGIAGGAGFVVTLFYFVHRVPCSIVEHCKVHHLL